LSRKTAANSIKGLFVITMAVWFVIWLFANDNLRGNLDQALKSAWSEIAK
jgi:hypothetical protein